MSERFDSIKQLARKTSSLFGSATRRKDSRNLTPPSPRPNPGGDPNITPPTLEPGVGPSPDDPLIGTPPSPPPSWSFRGRVNKPSPSTKPRDPPQEQQLAHARYLAQGVTGSDPTLPLFEGTTTNLADHLIEFDDSSMETAPDVRVYFWMIGKRLQEDPDSNDYKSMTKEERIPWDAKLVREGRLKLKACREEGRGFYIDKERLLAFDVAGRCPPGSKWWRMPACALIDDFQEGIITFEPSETEGLLNATNRDINWKAHEFESDNIDGIILTNIRADLYFAGCLREGVVPGTIGFDYMVQATYSTPMAHPVRHAWCYNDNLFWYIHGRIWDDEADLDTPYDAEVLGRKVVKNWPKENEDPPEQEKVSAKQIAELMEIQGITARDFLGNPSSTKKEEKNRAKQERKGAKKVEKQSRKGK